jgi:hypothetical protein
VTKLLANSWKLQETYFFALQVVHSSFTNYLQPAHH